METEMPKARAKDIQELRMKRGWPQEQLAEFAGISLKSVQRAESGKSISLDTLQALASALDVTVEYLVEIKAKERENAKASAPSPESKPPKIHHLPRLKT